MDQRDTAIEYLRHLDLTSIKRLCSSSPFYRDVCKTPLAQQIIKTRYIEQQVNDELPNILNDDNFLCVTYTISDRHTVNIGDAGPNRYKITESIGDLGGDFDFPYPTEDEDFATYRANKDRAYDEYRRLRDAKPKLTPVNQNMLAKESILVHLFPNTKKALDYNKLNMRFSTTVAPTTNPGYGLSIARPSTAPGEPPEPEEKSIQIGDVGDLLGMVLEEIFIIGKPEIKRSSKNGPAICPAW